MTSSVRGATRKRAGAWLGLLLTSAAFVVGTPASAATKTTSNSASQSRAVSPAQQLFNAVNRLVQNNYGGLSAVDRVALTQEYQQRLNAVCGSDLPRCPLEKAFPVIQAEISALGDEHSFFQTPEDFEDFVTSATGGERKQFGVKLAELDGENRVVLEVVPQSAAEDAGLRRGDVLQTLDGQAYTYDALRQARIDGRQIQLGLDRAGQRLSLSLVPRESSTRDLPRLSYLGAAREVAVIRIPTFLAGGGVAQKVHDLVAQARADHAGGILIDLRGDSGGSLTECDGAVSAFVPEFARISRTAEGDVQTRVSGGVRVEGDQVRGSSVKNPQLWTGPVAVLVDQRSASCSEFFAYEIQYSRRGPVLGEDTAGVANTATRVFETPGDTALQLTITNYVKPDGTPYPVRVTPDETHVQTEDDLRRLTRGEDTLLNLGVQALSRAPSLSDGPK